MLEEGEIADVMQHSLHAHGSLGQGAHPRAPMHVIGMPRRRRRVAIPTSTSKRSTSSRNRCAAPCLAVCSTTATALALRLDALDKLAASGALDEHAPHHAPGLR